jgi:hypothetical protein
VLTSSETGQDHNFDFTFTQVSQIQGFGIEAEQVSSDQSQVFD